MRKRSAAAAALVLLLVAASGASARPEPPGVHALVGARVVVAPGRVLPRATVVVRDGLIAGVGAALEPPADARIWQLEGRTIYPGLLDAWVLKGKAPAPEQQHYVMATLIRGGVFGEAG